MSFFECFKIDKKVILEALADLYVGDDKDDFQVYVFPEDRSKAVQQLASLFKGFNENPLMFDAWNYHTEQLQAYKNLIDALTKIDPNFYVSVGDEDELSRCQHMPQNIKDLILLGRERLDVKTADEVMLDNDDIAMVIHFNDNCIDGIDAMSDGIDGDKTKYESEAYTCQRFIEVLFNWLVEHKKVDPSAPELLEMFKVSDEMKEKYPGKASYLEDDIYNWKRLCNDAIVHAMYHEG